MAKCMTGYCRECRRETRHTVIECTENIGWRIFENLFTFGTIAASFGYDYKCECIKCGEINTLHK